MSVKVMGWVWDQDLPQNEKFVLLAYADHADHDGNNIYPSIDLIARKTGYSRRSIQRIVDRLKDKLYLMPDGVSPRGTNKYIIPMPMPAPAGGARMTPPGVTPAAKGGDTAVSPEPSVNRHDSKPNPPTPRKRKPAPLTADDIMMAVAVPDKFVQSTEFMSTWYAYLEHRIEMRKPMSTRGGVMLMNKLKKYHVDVAIAAMQDSIANGWQGVFPEKYTKKTGPARVSKSSQAREDMDNYLRRDLEKNLMGGTNGQ